MRRFNLNVATKLTTIIAIAAGVNMACTPKNISSNTGDNKVYNDDSEIIMKTTEKKGKMPFDTSSAPRIIRNPNKLETQ